MKGVIHRRDGERRDLITIYRHYAAEAGLKVADRFLAAAEKTFERLAGMPGMGTRYQHNHPALADLRYLPLSTRFKVYLVFYQPVTDGISVVRVLHGARDIQGILAEEFDIDEDAAQDTDD